MSVNIGPQIGFNVNSKVKFADDGETKNQDLEGRNKLDLAAALGLGYQLDMGLFFQGRYNLGLSNIYKDNILNQKSTNTVLQFSVGYMF